MAYRFTLSTPARYQGIDRPNCSFYRRMGLTGDLFIGLLGADGMLTDSAAPDGGIYETPFLNHGCTTRGGTDDVQRDSLEERVLGLPREPHVDKDPPSPEMR